MFEYPALSELVGTTVLVKHENHQPVGAFKVRGGINLISRMSADERARGVIAASTGNHGQSVAYGAKLFDVPAIICAPENANPVKVDAMQRMGAEVVLKGAKYDDAREHCEELAEEHGYRYIHSGNEPLLIAGVGTYALEVLEKEPSVEVFIVPVGGGSGAAGTCLVAKEMGQAIVIGVQSQASPAAYLSWKQRDLVTAANETMAEGLATSAPMELPQRIMWNLLDDFLMVSDEAIGRAVVEMIEKTRNLVEPAGAAALAGALEIRERLAGKTVCIICSGGNISPDQLRALLAVTPV